jgi:hypothetical protein
MSADALSKKQLWLGPDFVPFGDRCMLDTELNHSA